ncbi:hypothetical protein BU14_0022s0055 [Porphyra umbilicalis]|uniref:guanylate kinase n=1 Tax=Porphyra umbilicalis TaxID=2786 RepID=A0A1X6PKK8_PORUM|nr:hypothetical protein BU14_0022s0055 [Porphyra umbilicalis]|eukprot:OSX81335.1 hypothetical protein BU14_0022s0055 [Porphyra umbilicalis]
MTGRLVKAAARALVRASGGDVRADEAGTAATSGVASSGGGAGGVLVFAGPSGVGKSTLIRRLLADYPDRFGLSVSHTTRPPRAGEEDGVAYNFVTDAEFVALIDGGAFLEHARVHDHRYGTAVAAVAAVAAAGKVCILDVDVQGVAAVRAAAGPRLGAGGDEAAALALVWVAPPSLEVLEGRLRGRGTEDEASVRRRLDAAVREMRWAATNPVWDVTLVSDDADTVYAELVAAVKRFL